MAEIHYCDADRSSEWDYSRHLPEHYEHDKSQAEIDEWVIAYDTKYFPPESVAPIPSLAQSFSDQAEKWDRETKHISSPSKRIMHPSYQAILGMGEAVVPLMLRDLRDNRRSWFWALSYLTKANPIDAQDAGKMDKMITAWVLWGSAKGIL